MNCRTIKKYARRQKLRYHYTNETTTKGAIVDTSSDVQNNPSSDNQETVSKLDQSGSLEKSSADVTSHSHFAGQHVSVSQTTVPETENPQAQAAPASQSPKQPYVHQRRAHKTVEPISDFSRPDEEEVSTLHDSGFTLGKSGRGSRNWKKANGEIAQLRKDLHYGQYLQVPKGQRDIFAKKERRSNAWSLIAAVIVLLIVAVVIYFLWTWMSTNWGVAIR